MATTYYAYQTGNWATNATWSTNHPADATNAGTYPVAGDTANLDDHPGAITVTVAAAAACTTLNCTGFTGTLAFGTQTLILSGTTPSATFVSPMTVTGTTGGISMNAAGSIVGGGLASFPATLTLGSGAKTINASGTTWATIVNNTNVTLQAAFAATLFTTGATAATHVWDGNYDLTLGTLRITYITNGAIKFRAGQTVNVTTALNVAGNYASASTLSSDTGSSPFTLNYTGTVDNCKVSGMAFTDVNYTGSTVTTLINWQGSTLTRTDGIYNAKPDSWPAVAAVLDTTGYGGVDDAPANRLTGTIATRTLSAASTTVAAGYYAADDLATRDTDLVLTNIKNGVTIFGVTGNYTGGGGSGGVFVTKQTGVGLG